MALSSASFAPHACACINQFALGSFPVISFDRISFAIFASFLVLTVVGKHLNKDHLLNTYT